MHPSQFSSNFKLRFFRENRIDKTQIPDIVNTFGQIAQIWTKVSFKWPCGQFLRQKQWCSDTWCPEKHPSHTHKRVLVWGSHSKTKSNKYQFLLICCQPTFATKFNKTMCWRTYNNSHVAEIVTTKIIIYSKLLLRQNLLLQKANHQSWQCSYTDLIWLCFQDPSLQIKLCLPCEANAHSKPRTTKIQNLMLFQVPYPATTNRQTS